MKLTVTEIGGATWRDDGLLSLGVKAGRKVHTIEFKPETTKELLMALIASPRDPLGRLSRRIQPNGVSRFQIEEYIGLSFLLAPQTGIHMVLHRQLANALQNLLETFDDSSTWNVSKLH